MQQRKAGGGAASEWAHSMQGADTCEERVLRIRWAPASAESMVRCEKRKGPRVLDLVWFRAWCPMRWHAHHRLKQRLSRWWNADCDRPAQSGSGWFSSCEMTQDGVPGSVQMCSRSLELEGGCKPLKGDPCPRTL
eukprot:236236-Rhodomonas_salina.1